MQPFRAPVWLCLAGLLLLVAPASVAGAPPHRAAAEPAALAVTDLVIDDIEITQGIQDLNNSVPLIEGKRTFVRVYVHSTSGLHPTTATLNVVSGALNQKLLPIAPGGPLINVRPTYNRLWPYHAFLFELPLWATFVDTLTLTAVVNPPLPWRPHDPVETSYSNNTLVAVVSFDYVAKLHLVLADQPYTFNNVTYAPTAYDRWKAAHWLEQVFPLSQVKIYIRTLPTMPGARQLNDDGLWDLTTPYCGWLGLYLAYQKAVIFGNPFVPFQSAFYALVADDMGFMQGCAQRGGLLTYTGYTRTGAGPTGDKTWGWDYDGTYGDWYTGHELGHAFGRPHVRGGPGVVKGGCGGEDKAVKHNDNGRISPTTNIFDPTAIFGFDPWNLILGINPILGPNWSDVMTYCPYQWISKVTYLKLKEVLGAYVPLAAEAALQPATPQDVLAVFGTLNPQTEAVTLLPVSTLFDLPDVTLPEPGPYAIVLRDGDGSELARYPFIPGGLEPGPAPTDYDEPDLATITALVPAVPNATRLEIEGPSGVLHTIEAGLALPAVQLTAPNGGEVLTGPITATWTASDEDGDPLTFNVAYSPDNGLSWEPVALFITTTQVVIPATNLPESDMGRLRVTASDGLHSAQDTSDNIFTIPNHLPTGEIVAPATDITVAASQTVALAGQVYDIDLGMLDETSLEWVSDQDGSLGYGANLSVAGLSVNLHEINLVADDGHGPITLDQVIVVVVASPNDLPTPENQLTAGPDLVFLDPASGVFSATLYLDNLRLGEAVAWQVTAAEDWVGLSAESGLTPQDIVVTTSLTSRDYGTHKALLTFTSPTDAYDPVYVVVIVTSAERHLFVPLTMR